MSEELPPLAILVRHEVADYDTFKTAFDGHASIREEAGIVGTHVNRNVNDPKWVSVYLAATDRGKAEALLGSEGLRDAMKEAGVVGKPQITLMKPIENNNLDMGPGKQGALIITTVADFATWKAAFDANGDNRRAAGITGHGINTELDDDTKILGYLQAESQDGIRAFFESDEVKKVMKEAGVTGPPEIVFTDSQG